MVKLLPAIKMDPRERKILNDNLKDELVPYEGANSDIDLGANGISLDYVQFNTDVVPRVNVDGLAQWNATDGTLDLGMSNGNVSMQLGQELFVKVSNKTGSMIQNGSAVYISGRLGNRPLIALAIGNDESKSSVIGLTTEDIDDDAEGFVTTTGYVRTIKTDYPGWNEGDTLWLSTTTPGALTNVAPSVPHYSMSVGQVGIVHSNLGSIFVRLLNNRTLVSLSDVNGTPLTTDGQMLVWHNTGKYFDFDKNINSYVPYVGATDDVDLTGYHVIVDQWDDLRFPATTSRLGALNKPDFDYTNNGLLFPQNDTSEVIYIIAQMPHGYKYGTNMKPHIHFIQTSSSVPVFKLKYRWYEIGAAVPAFTTITSTTVAYTYVSGSIHQVLRFPEIDGSSVDSVSAILDIQIWRDDNVVTGDVLMKEFDIHYRIDTFGSLSEGIK